MNMSIDEIKDICVQIAINGVHSITLKDMI